MRKRLSLQRMGEMAESPGEFDVGQACLNGHAITGSLTRSPELAAKFCKHCGEPTISTCPKCNKAIRGQYKNFYGSRGWQPPNYCHECGAAYPWTERKAAALAEAIDELGELPQEERDKLKLSIPDVVSDTPKTQTAASRFGRAITSAGQWGGKLLSDVLAKVASEAALSYMSMK
jgi:hypothetical protein